MNVSASFWIASSVSGAVPPYDRDCPSWSRPNASRVIAMLFAMYCSSWAYVLGSTREALDRLRVQAAEDDRGREPDDRRSTAQRPHPAGERARRSAGPPRAPTGTSGRRRPGTARWRRRRRRRSRRPPGCTRARTCRAGSRRRPTAGTGRRCTARWTRTRVTNTSPPASRGQQVAGAGDRERGEEQAVDQRLDEAVERQLEQEERRCRGRRPGRRPSASARTARG